MWNLKLKVKQMFFVALSFVVIQCKEDLETFADISETENTKPSDLKYSEVQNIIEFASFVTGKPTVNTSGLVPKFEIVSIRKEGGEDVDPNFIGVDENGASKGIQIINPTKVDFRFGEETDFYVVFNEETQQNDTIRTFKGFNTINAGQIKVLKNQFLSEGDYFATIKVDTQIDPFDDDETPDFSTTFEDVVHFKVASEFPEGVVPISTVGIFRAIGGIKLSEINDDADNGDGEGDGAIYVDGFNTVKPQGLRFTFDRKMQSSDVLVFQTVLYNTGTSFSAVNVVLYNVTDDRVLSSKLSGPIRLASSFGPVDVRVDYTATAEDQGDVLEVRFERTDDANTVRDFAIDVAKINGIALVQKDIQPLPVDIVGKWEGIGDVSVSEVNDDADNGDGINDGALLVSGLSSVVGQGAKFTLENTTLIKDHKYEISSTVYKVGNSSSNVRLAIYNATDNVELATSEEVLINTKNSIQELKLDYLADTPDDGDRLEVRLVRTDDGNKARRFAIDRLVINGQDTKEKPVAIPTVNTTGKWEEIGDVLLTDVTDDADNGDGAADGALLVIGKSSVVGQGVKYVFDNETFVADAKYNFSIVNYNTGNSFSRIAISLYNATDNVELVREDDGGAGILLRSIDEPITTTLSYKTKATDVGDKFELRFVRVDDGNKVRRFSIDSFNVNSSVVQGKTSN